MKEKIFLDIWTRSTEAKQHLQETKVLASFLKEQGANVEVEGLNDGIIFAHLKVEIKELEQDDDYIDIWLTSREKDLLISVPTDTILLALKETILSRLDELWHVLSSE